MRALSVTLKHYKVSKIPLLSRTEKTTTDNELDFYWWRANVGFTWRTWCNTLTRFQGWNLAASTGLWRGMRRVLVTPADVWEARQEVQGTAALFWLHYWQKFQVHRWVSENQRCVHWLEFPTFAGTAGPKPETRLLLFIAIRWPSVELAIQTVCSLK